MRAWMVLLAGALALCLWSGSMAVWLSVSRAPCVPRPSSDVMSSPDLLTRRVSIAALELRPVDGGLLLSGEVPSAAVAAELLSKAQTMYAPLRVQDGLRVRTEAEASAWLAAALAGLPLPMPGIEQPEWLLSAEGLRVGGVAADAATRDAVRAQLAQRFPGIAHADQLRLATSPAPTPSTEPAAVTESASAAAPQAAHPLQPEIDALLLARPVMFASGSPRLRSDTGPDWQALVSLIEAAGSMQVQVRGHTDDRGRAEANRRLSARRAESVKQALVRAGLPAARIRVEGVGADEPKASNATEDGRRQNRRIEIRLIAERGA